MSMVSDNQRFTVLHSSAGAGKTHALVTEYLLKVLSYPDPRGFKRVLALTFTNKAAREMSDRVIEYLRELAHSTPDSKLPADISSVVDRLCTELSCSRSDLHTACGKVLRHFLHDRSGVAITTLDAFTKKVTQPFSRELRISYKHEMTTESDHYNNLAVEQLLDGADENAWEVLIRTCEQKADDEKAWSVKTPLSEVIKLLENEETSERLTYYNTKTTEEILDIRDRLSARTQNYCSQLQDAAKEALEAIDRTGIPHSDFPHKTALPKMLKELIDYSGGTLPSHSNALRPLSTGELLAKSYKGDHRSSAEALYPQILPQLKRISELIDRFDQEELIPRAIRNELLLVASLSFLDQSLKEVKEEDGVLYFSDLTHKISQIVQDEPTPFIYERTGERYEHILIDEFQDTSVLQWHNLIPLIENALANGGSAFLVGDAKQAIYRWRNGEVRQFVELPAIRGKEKISLGEQRERALRRHFVERPQLQDNYRSDRAVIEFNNDFFSKSSRVLSNTLQEVYKDHAQNTIKSRHGYVDICAIQGANGEKIDDLRTKSMVEVLAVIDRCVDLGYKHADMVLLVRTATLGRFVADFLTEHGVQVSSPDSFLLGSNPVVQLIIELMRYSDRRNDPSAARIHALIQSTGKRNDLITQLDPEFPDVRWLSDHLLVAAKLPKEEVTLYELISSLMTSIGHNWSDDLMMLTLLELAHDHGKMGMGGVHSFLDQYEREYYKRGVQLSVNENAVRIMTVHKSKGLGIPIVIIPFAEMSSGGKNQDPLWINAEHYGLKHAMVKHSKALVNAGVQKAMEESDLQLLDQINLFYVACTRAKNRLHVFVQKPGSNRGAGPVSKELLAFMDENGSDTTHVRGEENEPAPDSSQLSTNEVTLSKQPSGGNTTLVYRKEAPVGWKASDPDPYRTHGEVVHALFERIGTINDLETALTWANSGEPLPAELPARIRSLFDMAEVRSLYDPENKWLNEPALILKSGRTVRPDRIVFRDGSVDVLDIKTGDRSSSHVTQVQGYIDAIRDLGQKEVNGHILYLKEQQLIAV